MLRELFTISTSEWIMKKAELQQALLELLYDGPEWQYERFLQEHWIE